MRGIDGKDWESCESLVAIKLSNPYRSIPRLMSPLLCVVVVVRGDRYERQTFTLPLRECQLGPEGTRQNPPGSPVLVGSEDGTTGVGEAV